MMRKLNKIETELTTKNVKKAKEKLIRLKEDLLIYQETQLFQKTKREYDDKVRPLNRKKEDEQLKNIITEIKSQILMSEEGIKVSEKQLNEGVEVKWQE